MSLEESRTGCENGIIAERRELQILMMSVLAVNGFSCDERAQIGCFIMRNDSVRDMFCFDVYSCSRLAIQNNYGRMANHKLVKLYSHVDDFSTLKINLQQALKNKVESAKSNAVDYANIKKGCESLASTLTNVTNEEVNAVENSPEKEILGRSSALLSDTFKNLSTLVDFNVKENDLAMNGNSVLA